MYRMYLFCVLFFSAPLLGQEVPLYQAVVKVYATNNVYNYGMPWQAPQQREGTGSGCILEGQHILTNAHVVANAAFLEVRKAGEAKRYPATVEAVGHDCDLALLKVDDPDFFRGVTPLPLGKMPSVRDRVGVFGFPIGGEEMSITEGIVSRVELVEYAHSGASLLACQIDASINPGNSGGPVILHDAIAGIAFQANVQGEGIGYMIALPVIRHFLREARLDDFYRGFPQLGVSLQTTENEDLQRKLGMQKGQTGVLIKNVSHRAAAYSVLQPHDVIMEIDGTPIAHDGSVSFRPGERVSFSYFIHQKYVGDSVDLKILREGKEQNVTVSLNLAASENRLVPFQQYDHPPTYYTVGGFVFQPLELNFLMSLWGPDWYYIAPKKLVHYLEEGSVSPEREQVVLLTRVLPDRFTRGYQQYRNRIIKEVNGVPIVKMQDLVRAFESEQGPWHVILTEEGLEIVFDRAKTPAAHQEIMEKYRLSEDRSEDLVDV